MSSSIFGNCLLIANVTINPNIIPIMLPIIVEHITKIYLDRITCFFVSGNVNIYL